MNVPQQLLPILVPNTDVVLITERRHITKVGGTKEQPLIWIKGIPRAFVLANSKNLPDAAKNKAIIQPVETANAEAVPSTPLGDNGDHTDGREPTDPGHGSVVANPSE